ncbi:hypothetical protein [Streptomyces sp. NBC_00078]|uniref:hypothetical protein n=1 Tax=unclassified Streptomyces TaxID=2593676 RepID=UPI00225248E3|nr:hypothetical protein [Streptomyces sp. NBC_00078]MCX5420629.1 hypothetical protein [Streptomyces sp. NBC_00078]
MRILEIEASRYGWQRMSCGCNRSAEHIPRDFMAYLQGPTPGSVGEGWADNHAYIQSNLMEPAPATAGMVAASLAASEVSVEWRPHLLAVLSNLVYGEQEEIAESCKEAVRGCTEILFEEIVAGRSKVAAAYAFELLMAYEDLKARLRIYQVEARSNLPADLHLENLDLDAV